MRIFDEEAQARQSVRSSARMLEEASLTGEAILSAMSGSRERLKVFVIKLLHIYVFTILQSQIHVYI